LEIFFHLDEYELWNCEKVCVDWKNVISCETLWKKILLHKVKKTQINGGLKSKLFFSDLAKYRPKMAKNMQMFFETGW